MGYGPTGGKVGYPGLEPETSPLSGARSTTELIARALVTQLHNYYTSHTSFHATPMHFSLAEGVFFI